MAKSSKVVSFTAGTHLRDNLESSKKRTSGMRMEHEIDPAEEILEAIGDLKGVEVLNNYVLYAIYERPNKTKGGIYITDPTRTEDQYQGKTGLILKIGKMVNFEADERGLELKPGQWIAVRASDGWGLKINGKMCRMIGEKSVHMIVPAPDMVW